MVCLLFLLSLQPTVQSAFLVVALSSSCANHGTCTLPHLLRSLAVVLTQAVNDDSGHLVWNNKSPAYKSITAVYINTAPLRATPVANAHCR